MINCLNDQSGHFPAGGDMALYAATKNTTDRQAALGLSVFTVTE